MSAEEESKKVDLSVEEDQTDAVERRKQGEFVRGISTARNWLDTKEDAEFKAEAGRYHLFIAMNCPWCHRTALTRGILGLEDSITMDICFPNRTDESDERGKNLWQFAPDKIATSTGAKLPECTAETGTGKSLRLIIDVYNDAGIIDQKSVPIFYDKKTKRVVSNESAEIIRMLGQFASELGAKNSSLQLYPDTLSKEIDELNGWIYTDIANGAYKAGFSSKQSVYDEAFDKYFNALDRLEKILEDKQGGFLLTKDEPTEADIRLFPVMYRHDPVYFTRMKLNKAMIKDDYPFLWKWLRAMYQYPGIKQACNLQHCKQGYFGRTGYGVVPKGPEGYPLCYEMK